MYLVMITKNLAQASPGEGRNIIISFAEIPRNKHKILGVLFLLDFYLIFTNPTCLNNSGTNKLF
jgi:hypothetical protein